MGALLATYGMLSPARSVFRPDMSAPHMHNLNLWWGLVMLLFGLLMCDVI